MRATLRGANEPFTDTEVAALSLRKRLGRSLAEAWFDYAPKPLEPETIRKAVVFIPKSIGDGMAVFPVIRALQARSLEWLGIVASARNAAVFEPLQGDGVELFVIPRDRDYRQVRQTARSIRQRCGRVDLCVDATLAASSPAIHFVGTLKARMNLQLSSSTMRAYAPLCNEVTTELPTTPLPGSWSRLMARAGIADVPARYELPIAAEVEEEVIALTADLGRYVAFNLDGSIPERSIPLDQARRLSSILHRSSQLPVVIPCAPGGEPKALELAATMPDVHVVPTARTVPHSAAIIKHAELLVSPDTAAIHMASAFDRPTLGIYLAEPSFWQPLATHSRTVTASSLPLLDDQAFEQALTELLALRATPEPAEGKADS